MLARVSAHAIDGRSRIRRALGRRKSLLLASFDAACWIVGRAREVPIRVAPLVAQRRRERIAPLTSREQNQKHPRTAHAATIRGWRGRSTHCAPSGAVRPGPTQLRSSVAVPSSSITIFTGALPGANKYMCRTSRPEPGFGDSSLSELALATGVACVLAQAASEIEHKQKATKRMTSFLLHAEGNSVSSRARKARRMDEQ